MTRVTLALIALLVAAQLGAAAPSPQPATPKPKAPEPPAPAIEPAKTPALPAPDEEYVLTEKTKVFLDDRPCKYDNVPNRAVITNIELAGDNKTLVKIYFRSKRAKGR